LIKHVVQSLLAFVDCCGGAGIGVLCDSKG